MSGDVKLILSVLYVVCWILFEFSFKFQYLVGFIWGKICKNLLNMICGVLEFFEAVFSSPIAKSISSFHTDMLEARAEKVTQQYFGEYNEYEEPNNLHMDSTVIIGLLYKEISKKYEFKFNKCLTETDKSVIVSSFLYNRADYRDMIEYVNEHPLLSAYLIDKFVELYHQRKSENKPISFFEIQMFIETAKLFK